MKGSLSTLKRLALSPSVKSRPAASHLCQSCHNLIITQNLIKDIPESYNPDGSVALDLIQGFIDLPMKKKDRSPEFRQLKETASSCEFCAALYDAIMRDLALFPGLWAERKPYGDVEIRFRYSCAPTPGRVNFEAGQWPTILSALEAVIRRRDDQQESEAVVIVFKVYSEPCSCILQ